LLPQLLGLADSFKLFSPKRRCQNASSRGVLHEENTLSVKSFLSLLRGFPQREKIKHNNPTKHTKAVMTQQQVPKAAYPLNISPPTTSSISNQTIANNQLSF